MELSKYLEESGLLTLARDKHERKRLKEFALRLYRLIGNKASLPFTVTKDEMAILGKAIELCRGFCSLDVRTTEELPYKSVSVGFSYAFYKAMSLKLPVHLVSFASNAINYPSRTLREKKQYREIGRVISSASDVLGSLGLAFDSSVVLADYDFLIPTEGCKELWERNLDYLRSECGTEAVLLSEFIGRENNSLTTEYLNDSHLASLEMEAKKFSDNPFLCTSFKTTPERIYFQLVLYSSVGMWFEHNLPTCVVMDVQKQMYPYEQLYFNRFRRMPLPLFRTVRRKNG